MDHQSWGRPAEWRSILSRFSWFGEFSQTLHDSMCWQLRKVWIPPHLGSGFLPPAPGSLFSDSCEPLISSLFSYCVCFWVRNLHSWRMISHKRGPQWGPHHIEVVELQNRICRIIIWYLKGVDSRKKRNDLLFAIVPPVLSSTNRGGGPPGIVWDG